MNMSCFIGHVWLHPPLLLCSGVDMSLGETSFLTPITMCVIAASMHSIRAEPLDAAPNVNLLVACH